jgi:hypothetical protein
MGWRCRREDHGVVPLLPFQKNIFGFGPPKTKMRSPSSALLPFL